MLEVLFPWRRGNNAAAEDRNNRDKQVYNGSNHDKYPLNDSKGSEAGTVTGPGSSFGGEFDDSHLSPLRLLLDDMNMIVMPHADRLDVVTQAANFFDHRDRAQHDEELREGAAHVLYQKLAFALHISNSSHIVEDYRPNQGLPSPGSLTRQSSKKLAGNSGPSSLGGAIPDTTAADLELATIASCLEMVHRASSSSVATTWQEVGQEVLPLLIRILERPFERMELAVEMANQERTQPHDRAIAVALNRDVKMAVQKVTKLLAIYSLVPEAKESIAYCHGMLPILVKIIDTHGFNRVKSLPKRSSERNREGMHESFGHESFRENSATGMNGVRGAVSGSGLHMTEAARFNAIATLTNLAAAERNRMKMLGEPGLVENIARVVHNERSDVARQCSALAIMNLSNGDRENVPELAGNEMLLETLIKLTKDDNPETRRNAAVALFNVACADQNTVKLARYRDGVILEALLDLVSSEDENVKGATSNTSHEARTNAAEAMFNMSCSEIQETTDRMANHPGLLEGLAVTLRSSTVNLDVKMYCAATLRRMAEITNAPMVSHSALLTALVKASSWTRTACISEAFKAQSAQETNRTPMVRHHGLLNAVSRLALATKGGDMETVRTAAVGAIVNLAKEESTRTELAHNEGVMVALTKATYGSGSVRSMGGSRKMGESNEENGASPDSEDEESLVQFALKNLVAAM